MKRITDLGGRGNFLKEVPPHPFKNFHTKVLQITDKEFKTYVLDSFVVFTVQAESGIIKE